MSSIVNWTRDKESIALGYLIIDWINMIQKMKTRETANLW